MEIIFQNYHQKHEHVGLLRLSMPGYIRPVVSQAEFHRAGERETQREREREREGERK